MVVVEGYCEVDGVVILANYVRAGWDEDWKRTTCGLMERMSGGECTSRLEQFEEKHKEVVILGVMLTNKQGG
jgi:hypothetical protein